jgi:hypothetical protein
MTRAIKGGARILVQIIEDETEAGGAEYIEFVVWRSPTGDIRGWWHHAREEPDRRASVMGSRPFTPIEGEFRRVLDWAEASHIPFVWVDDPEELFPPSVRPAV